MASKARTLDRMLRDAFYAPPIFRMGFDAHVRAWRHFTANEFRNEYWKLGDFARAFHAERELRATANRLSGLVQGEKDYV